MNQLIFCVFASELPMLFTILFHSSSGKCSFAANITRWTNHGLWPSVNQSYPNNCNDSWQLKESDIAPIVDEMRAHWPSYDGKYGNVDQVELS